MPKFTLIADDMQTSSIPGLQGFNYSAVRPDKLGAASYMLVTIAMDRSSSVASFRDLLVDSIVKAINACAKSPLAANILVRVITFGNDVQEVHGFKPLAEIDTAKDYNSIQCRGSTALYSACASAVGATADYGRVLSIQDYAVSGILFVITDGEDNMSPAGQAAAVKDQVDSLVTGEVLEVFTSVLVGVNATNCSPALKYFQTESGITQYVDAGDATPGNLAKLAAFVSRSVSSTAQGNAGGISI